MRSILILLLSFVVAFAYGTHEKAEGIRVLMFVSEGSHHKTETALTMAKSLLSSGGHVVVVLEGPSVKLADRDYKGKSPYRKALTEVIKEGGQVYAYPYWGRKLKVEALAEGLQWTNPQVVFPMLADEKTKVMVW